MKNDQQNKKDQMKGKKNKKKKTGSELKNDKWVFSSQHLEFPFPLFI